jgi:hypothetical protein
MALDTIDASNRAEGNLDPSLDGAALPPASNRHFITQAFLDMLGRPVDPTGLAAFANVMAHGGAEAVLRGIMSSDEYRAHQVDKLFQRFLHRSADPAGLSGSLAALRAGATLEAVRAGVVGSAEYFNTRGGGTEAGFLAALYQDGLGRQIDPTGLAGMSARLSAGASRAAVADSLFHSAEGLAEVVQGLYQRFLHRDADAGGTAGFVAALSHGATEEQVIAALVGSPESASRA